MTPQARSAHRTRRLAVAAAAALVAGLVSGTGSQADETRPPVMLAYDCVLPEGAPSGAARVRTEVEVTTRAPGTAKVGEPIAPGPVAVAAALPYDDLAPALPEGTTALASEAALDVRVRQNGESADTRWSPLTAAAGVPGDDAELRLDHTGQVPAVTVGSPGRVVLVAGELTLKITPLTRTGEQQKQPPDPADPTDSTNPTNPTPSANPTNPTNPTPSANPTDPTSPAAPVTLTCALADGQDGLLAEVTAEATGGTGAPGTDDPGTGPAEQPGAGIEVAPEQGREDGPDGCPAERPDGEIDLSDAPPPLPGTVLRPPTSVHLPVCAYAVGYGTVRKLDGSMVINDPERKPALMNVWANKHNVFSAIGSPRYALIGSAATIDLPDAESTFLAFGFTPVSAKVRFETGPVSIGTGTIGSGQAAENFAFASFDQRLRIYDVKVNGTRLDVGPKCGTAKPYHVTLRGSFGPNGTGSYTNVLLGGLLTAKIDIPEFSGCGTGGEDLDALFTAAISGPDNSIAMNQATVCSPEGNGRPGCPAAVPPLPSLTLPSN
ncbi:hypothetical protein QIS99_08490 [Streptomyces sp. B-S-A8]|uniref:Secreted protein n=1 Tax=Streptomyces solicavernae TaxID=3043614 RepID=A0ABT6RPA5_9ACTN|nr:hypothetical protein [Streptomyces sp. B-S-A8]MDI3386252.1 hypothetical protein [Streptomyces sp. B-S-A8]